MSFYSQFQRFVIMVFLYCFSCSIYALEKNKDISLNNEIKNVLDANRKKYNLPAISLSIKLPNDNQINNYVSGYYSLSNKKNITPETLFQIGSITKTFTATIIFKLIEENKLNWSDNLANLLPQYPRWKNIKIYDLLHHTSGIYNYTSGKYFDDLLNKNPQKYWSLNELADIAYKHPDLYAPGKKFNYTNTDYILLGIIIEKVTNKSIQQIFNTYLKEYSLHHTFYSPSNYSDLVKNRIAHGYNRDGTFNLNTDVTFVSMSSGQTAGAMISTPNDIIKWLNYLFTEKIISNKSLADMTKIISAEDANPINIKELQIPKKLTDSTPFAELGIGSGIGLIYFKDNGLNWVHAGGTPGYESFYTYNPCNGIYLALTYNVKPKQQLVFIQIANEIFRKLHQSAEVVRAIKAYQHNNLLPEYCNYAN